MMSLAPPLLTLPTLVFSASEPLLRTGSAGEKKGEGRGRERKRGRLTVIVVFSIALMADAVVIEADPWGRSDVSMETLQSLINDGLLCPVTDSNRPEWIAPSGELELRPRDGYIVSFVSFHEHGLGLPVDRFMRVLLRYYSVELHNFNPNSIT